MIPAPTLNAPQITVSLDPVACDFFRAGRHFPHPQRWGKCYTLRTGFTPAPLRYISGNRGTVRTVQPVHQPKGCGPFLSPASRTPGSLKLSIFEPTGIACAIHVHAYCTAMQPCAVSPVLCAWLVYSIHAERSAHFKGGERHALRPPLQGPVNLHRVPSFTEDELCCLD